MPHSPTHPLSASSAASVAYGMGSTHAPASAASAGSFTESSSQPDNKSKAKSKPKLKPSDLYNTFSDFADLSSPVEPPPNRGADLDVSRFTSFERKAEAAALVEVLLLSWLRDQARYTLGPDVNLAELNLASRILYRLTAIQKTMLNLDAVLKAQSDNQPVPPLDDDPLPPPDEGDDDPEPPLGARASTPATPLPVTSHETPSANPLGSRTASSANAPACNAPTPSQPLPVTNHETPSANPLGSWTASSATPLPRANPINDLFSPANENRATISPAPHESNMNNALDLGHLTLDTPHSALRASHCPTASVRACPTLPLARLDRAHELNQSDLSRITGQPLPQTTTPSNPVESTASTAKASNALPIAAPVPSQDRQSNPSSKPVMTSTSGVIENPPP